MDDGRHVVVAGASFAGLGAAYVLRRQLGPSDTVTVISPGARFVFAPSLTWAALGSPRLHSSFALQPALEVKGIRFIRSHVRSIDVTEHTVRTEEEQLHFDRLVIATGGRPDTQAVPGLAGEFQTASWIVGEESAMEAWDVLRRVRDEPGPIVLGSAQGAGYLSAMYEVALALDTSLRRAGIRDRVPLTFVTAEPYLGHLGFGQTALRPKLERLFAERDIATHVDTEIRRIERHKVSLSNADPLDAAAIVIMPPFTTVADVAKTAGLTDGSGMIPVTREYRHVELEHIYAAGVASYFPEPVPPLGRARAPQTGYLSLHMGRAAGMNAAASLGRGEPASRTLPHVLDVRVLDGGSAGVAIASRGDDRLHNAALRLPGGVAHRLKGAIERYLVWRLRTGRIDLP